MDYFNDSLMSLAHAHHFYLTFNHKHINFCRALLLFGILGFIFRFFLFYYVRLCFSLSLSILINHNYDIQFALCKWTWPLLNVCTCWLSARDCFRALVIVMCVLSFSGWQKYITKKQKRNTLKLHRGERWIRNRTQIPHF